MKAVINLFLLLLTAFFGYLMYRSIKDPIEFSEQKIMREDAVSGRLREIRSAQQIYRDISGGSYAGNFDELITTLKTKRIPTISVFGDPDDPNFDGVIRYDTVFKAAIDTVNALGINLDSLRYIPFTGGKEFDIKADTTTYQKAKVNVIEVGTVYKTFMGEFADPKFKRFDSSFDPEKRMKFGSLTQPSLSGNWE